MSEDPLCEKIISDAIWKKTRTGRGCGQAFARRSPSEDDGSGVSRSGPVLESHGNSLAGFALGVGQLGCGLHMRFRRWTERGVWQRLWQDLQAEPFAAARDLLMDSTTVRAHPHAAGARQKKRSRASSGPVSQGIYHRKSMPLLSTKTVPRRAARNRRAGARRPAIEALYERLDPDNVLEAAALDRGYDAEPHSGSDSGTRRHRSGGSAHAQSQPEAVL